MVGTELVKKACDAWGVELSEIKLDTETFVFRKTFSYKGKPLNITWSPEVAEDLRALHGAEAENRIVRIIMDRLVGALLEFDDDAN